MPSTPPPTPSAFTCPRSNLRLGVLPTTPAVPLRGMRINRKHCTLMVARDLPGMCRWPLGCLFGVKAAGSCPEQPGSTLPGIARELIATSPRNLRHPRACRGSQPEDTLTASSSQPHSPSKLGAHTGASAGVGVPGQPSMGATGCPGEQQGWGQQWSS